MLHEGGQGVHAGSDSTDGETRRDRWVRVEKQRLDDIQDICVSEHTGSSDAVQLLVCGLGRLRGKDLPRRLQPSAGVLTLVGAPADGSGLLLLSGSSGSQSETAAGETLRSCTSSWGEAGTPPACRRRDILTASPSALDQNMFNVVGKKAPLTLLFGLYEEMAELLFMASW